MHTMVRVHMQEEHEIRNVELTPTNQLSVSKSVALCSVVRTAGTRFTKARLVAPCLQANNLLCSMSLSFL